ncbi:MAG: M56 family metallopeptidase [Roseburia sp.]|nr:M56 family metallopeptidase [Roseburia sp.]
METLIVAIFAAFMLCVLWVLSMIGNMTSMIIDTSILVILICLVRRLFRGKVSACAINSLWGLVVLRYLAAPLWLHLGRRGGSFQKLFPTSAVNTINSGVNAVRGWTAPEQLSVIDGSSPVRIDLFALSLPVWFFVLWIAGVIVVYLWSVYVNEKFRRQLFDNRITVQVPESECPYPVYKVPGIISPCVMRVRGKAGIYLTEEAAEDEEMREYVLVHELCHLKHRDLFWGNIRCIVLALNWFNPLIWLAAVLSKQDAEMACDERAVRRLGEAKRLRYGKILVDLVADTAVRKNIFFTATTMSCSRKELARRVRRIADGKSRFLVSGAVVVLTVVAACMTSFVTRADLRGLSPEETVQQYIYYRNLDYADGMAGLRFQMIQYDIRSQDPVSINSVSKCGNEEDSDISLDEAGSVLEAGEEAYDVCRLKVNIRKRVDDTEDEMERSKIRYRYSEEEFLLARETKESDWKIVRSTMDEEDLRSFWY